MITSFGGIFRRERTAFPSLGILLSIKEPERHGGIRGLRVRYTGSAGFVNPPKRARWQCNENFHRK